MMNFNAPYIIGTNVFAAYDTVAYGHSANDQ